MTPSTRRQFLDSVGRGMLVAGLGTSLATDLGFTTAFANDGGDELKFGKYDALVDLLQGTAPDKLQPILIDKLRKNETTLAELIAAGALANAETFGGEDYVGFHTAMAMLPAGQLAEMLPNERKPLPVLKVLYRNTQQIQQYGGASKRTLREQHAAEEATVENAGIAIRDACRATDVERAEKLFAPYAQRTLSGPTLEEAFNVLQPAMQDDINVHRFVFAHRTYGLAKVLGPEHAYTILRQCVRFCISHDANLKRYNRPESPIRALLPKLLDQHKLAGKSLGTRELDDAAVEELSRAIYQGPPEKSAEATAAALAEGISPEVVGEAISLASNLLTLRQPASEWRTHGDSAGVHSADATNAFRNMARHSDPQFAISGLIVAAYHVAIHRPFSAAAYPTADHRAAIKAQDQAGLIAEAEDAVRHNDQPRAAAAIALYGEAGGTAEAVLSSLLKFTISEDGRLHGEKFFQTVQEEYRTTRPAFRWRQMIALARVTASAYGYDRNDKQGTRAPGYEDACRLLEVSV